MNAAPEFLTPGQAARMLMVNPVTVRQWAARKGLRSLSTIGGHWRFLLSDIEEFARNQGIVLATNTLGRPDRVLIVDDDIAQTSEMTTWVSLRDASVQMQVATGPFEAGCMLESFRPQVIVFNMDMPWMDLGTICGYLVSRQSLAHVRVIVTASIARISQAQAIKDAGADAVVIRPVAAEQLLGHIGLPAIADAGAQQEVSHG